MKEEEAKECDTLIHQKCVAATLMAQEVKRMRILIKEFQVEVDGSVSLMLDIKSSITLSNKWHSSLNPWITYGCKSNR